MKYTPNSYLLSPQPLMRHVGYMFYYVSNVTISKEKYDGKSQHYIHVSVTVSDKYWKFYGTKLIDNT